MEDMGNTEGLEQKEWNQVLKEDQYREAPPDERNAGRVDKRHEFGTNVE